MNVSINKKEYSALLFAISQVGSDIEGASNEEFVKDAKEAVSALYSIADKYNRALYTNICRAREKKLS